jgi:hypothetical protein
MKILTTVLVSIMFCVSCYAEEYICNYSWTKNGKVYPTVIEVNGKTAIERNIFEYEVIENTSDELLLMKRFTKNNSGKDYPVGMALMVLDKKTGVFVRSNTFAGGDQNNHAIGTGEMLPRKK